MTPTFSTRDETLNRAFRIAVGDLLGNVLLHQSGILENPVASIMAGLDYESPWTRDAAINVWNAGSLLLPEASKNTLLGVLDRVDGRARIGGEYWDQVIWITGAWHHYLVTGDREFLSLAYEVTKNSLIYLEQTEFDESTGLFRGAACFQDGIAGYPDRYARTGGSSNIKSWISANPNARHEVGFGLPMKVCSTNALYFAGYRYAGEMARRLGYSGDEYSNKAENLQKAFIKHFWNDASGNLFYLFDAAGKCDSQEGLGASFALLFGMLSSAQADSLLKTQHITAHGIPCVWPIFERYHTIDGLGAGRHCGTVWPHVQGFWAEAALHYGRQDIFELELFSLASKAVRDAQFTEIYHPYTGEIYGGRQEADGSGEIKEWSSCRRQTWSATAFLRMVLHGLVGIRFQEDGVLFAPALPSTLHELTLSGIVYRGSELTIHIEGTGPHIKHFSLDGKKECHPFLASTIQGKTTLRIVMG